VTIAERQETGDFGASGRVEQIIHRHPPGREDLIAILQDIQEELGYLSEDSVRCVSQHTGISENEIYGLSTFYAQFRFNPPGLHSVCVCLGTACHVRGGQQVMAQVRQQLGVGAGQTTRDGRFDLSRLACIGCCALAPTMTVDGKVHARMTPQKARAVIDEYSGDDSNNG
jgi:NADH-quinone oxidoreductase subunit E